MWDWGRRASGESQGHKETRHRLPSTLAMEAVGEPVLVLLITQEAMYTLAPCWLVPRITPHKGFTSH